MLYRFAWVMMWITFRIFFRRIDLVGLEKLKSGKPAIIIANHPASFLDAMVLAVFLRRSIHFYVRGDIFAHPLAYRVLTMLHMIPIFSREHGVRNLEKNKRTFDRGRKLLEQGKLLLIFPEGFSRQSKQLEPFKKGAARVALQTAFEGGKVNELQVQTVAINYTFHHLGSNLLIRLGDSVTLETFEQQYKEFPAMAIANLNKAMSSIFQQNVIHVQDGSRTNLVESLIRMYYNSNVVLGNQLFDDFTAVCKRIDLLSQEDFMTLEKNHSDYEKSLNALRLTDKSILMSSDKNAFSHFWFVYSLAPFALLGKLIWWIPGRISIWIANKTVTRIDFYTSVLSGVMGFLGFLWWVVLISLSYAYLNYLAFPIALILPLLCFIYVQWEERKIDFFALLRAQKIKKKNPTDIIELMDLRSKIIS
jgi:glycerol-3-phosphate O-acyltransferase/dihydroxyacetone phosphate acyltransferase